MKYPNVSSSDHISLYHLFSGLLHFIVWKQDNLGGWTFSLFPVFSTLTNYFWHSKVKHLFYKYSCMKLLTFSGDKKQKTKNKTVPLVKADETGGLEGLVSLVPSDGSWEMFKGTSRGPGNSVWKVCCNYLLWQWYLFTFKNKLSKEWIANGRIGGNTSSYCCRWLWVMEPFLMFFFNLIIH